MIGCSPGRRLKPADAHCRAELPGIVEEALAQVIALLGKLDGLDGGAHDGRRQRIGEKIGPGALAHQIDDGPRRSDEASGRTAERLAERAGDDVDLHPGAGMRAASLRPDEAGRVAIIDHDDAIKAVGKRA